MTIIITPVHFKSPDVGDQVTIDKEGYFKGMTGTIEWRGRSKFDEDYSRYRIVFPDNKNQHVYFDQDEVTLINKSN